MNRRCSRTGSPGVGQRPLRPNRPRGRWPAEQAVLRSYERVSILARSWSAQALTLAPTAHGDARLLGRLARRKEGMNDAWTLVIQVALIDSPCPPQFSGATLTLTVEEAGSRLVRCAVARFEIVLGTERLSSEAALRGRDQSCTYTSQKAQAKVHTSSVETTEERVFASERLHPSELAPLRRAGTTTPAPGSIEERDALQAINQARYEDMYPQSRAQARRRLRRHWTDRERQLDGR
jgi:hypothetical protein